MAAEGRREDQLGDFRRYLQGQQDLSRQAVRNINLCVDENERLVAENGRLEAEIARLREAAPSRVTPSVVWPEPSGPLAFERLRAWAGALGQALPHFVSNIHRWDGFPDNRHNHHFIQNLTADQRYDIGLALYNGWIGDK